MNMKKCRITKRIVSLLLAVMLMVGIAAMSAIPAGAEEDRVNDARGSVAAVLIYFEEASSYTFVPSGESVFSWGSCFMVGDEVDNPGHAITNYHVVETYYKFGAGELVSVSWSNGTSSVGRMKIRIYFDTVSSNDFVEAYPVEADSKYDVALLRLETPTDKRKAIPLKTPDDSLVGKSVYLLGFPGISDNSAIGATSHFRVSDVSITSGIVSRLYTQQGTGWKQIMVDADMKSGNSGGPLITQDGRVIGINTHSYSSSTDRENVSVNIEHAITLLNRNGIRYMTEYPDAKEDPTEAPDTNPTASPETQPVVTPATQSPATVAPATTSESNNTMLIVIIAAVAVVAALIIIFLLVSKKNKSKQASAAPAAAPTPSAPAAPAAPVAPQPYSRPPMPPQGGYAPSNEGAGETSVLSAGAGETTVLSGQGTGVMLVRKSNGEKIKISKPEFVIGKELRRVDYCISDNSSISRTHAKLRVRSGRCYISDLGSTNCTFVNGTKLSPNQEVILSKGDIIKLSDEEFTFEG